MEARQDSQEEREVEVEELNVPDLEEVNDTDSNLIPINIDYNSRITSRRSSCATGNSGANYFESENNYSGFQSANRDFYGDSSCEEIEFSDEDQPSSAVLNRQKISLDGMNRIAGNPANSSLSYNYSSTTFKDDPCLTDSEYMSEDEGDIKPGKSLGKKLVDRLSQNLSAGLSFASSLKDGVSVKGTPLASLNIGNSYSGSILLKKKNLLVSSDIMDTPLMTCLEFLKAEHSDDGATDEEEFAADSNDIEGSNEKPVYNLLELSQNHSNSRGGNFLDDIIRHRGKGDQSSECTERKSSWTTELLVEDETSCKENDLGGNKIRSNRKKLSNAEDFQNECSTDEEDIDLFNKEWTETDESGGLRQITQIKTETSIKLEGDGDGSVFDSDGLVSTTSTTTTRVVTSVITHPDDQSDNEQHASDDDIRQSCEITVSEVVNDVTQHDE